MDGIGQCSDRLLGILRLERDIGIVAVTTVESHRAFAVFPSLLAVLKPQTGSH